MKFLMMKMMINNQHKKMQDMSLNVPLVHVIDEAEDFHNVEMRDHVESSRLGINAA